MAAARRRANTAESSLSTEMGVLQRQFFGSNRRLIECRCTESPPNGTRRAEGHENSHGPMGFEHIIGYGPAPRHVPELVNTVAFSESARQDGVESTPPIAKLTGPELGYASGFGAT